MIKPVRYKCLVLDHDDTVVNSTATIHYPSFVRFMREYRPDEIPTIEKYLFDNFQGLTHFFHEVMHFTPEEEAAQYACWADYVETHVPPAFDGMADFMARYRAAGGHICVVSHSLRRNILRDYRENGLPEPEMIFGWDEPEEMRKPSPGPLRAIMQAFSLGPADLLMVDDLKPGKDMADACGVDFAAVGWGTYVPEIAAFMRAQSRIYCETLQDLETLIFS